MKASVIIPAYNSRERLYLNLVALNNQTYEGDDIEVIVVDNGSTDDTFSMLSEIQLNYSFVKVRVKENKGIAFGRNEGIKRAQGDILIFHDSDMLAPKDFIEKHLAAHHESNMVVCGVSWKRIYTFYYEKFSKDQKKALTTYDLSTLQNAQQLISEELIKTGELDDYIFDLDIDFIKELKSVVAKYGTDFENYYLPWRFCITNNLSVERSKVLEVGMFDANIIKYGYEDYDLGVRLYKSGCKFKLAQDIISIHQEHPANFTYTDLMENINYICVKYNNIYFIDMLLVCMGYPLSSSDERLNNLTKEINQIILMRKYNFILGVFVKLIQFHRIRSFEPSADNTVHVNSYIAQNFPLLRKQMSELKYLHKKNEFIDQLNSMLIGIG